MYSTKHYHKSRSCHAEIEHMLSHHAISFSSNTNFSRLSESFCTCSNTCFSERDPCLFGLAIIHRHALRRAEKVWKSETTKTHWNHTSTISWHIITWFTNTNSDFSPEERREFAVFTVVTRRSLPGSQQLSPEEVCLVVDNCRQKHGKG